MKTGSIVLTMADQRSPRMVAILRRKANAARIAGVVLKVEVDNTDQQRATAQWLERVADIGAGEHAVFMRGLQALARGDLVATPGQVHA